MVPFVAVRTVSKCALIVFEFLKPASFLLASSEQLLWLWQVVRLYSTP